MFCTNCGIQQLDHAAFCHGCGEQQLQNRSGEMPKPPEYGILWSLFLTPIAGAIFWTANWRRIGKPRHQIWVWITAILVLLVELGLIINSGIPGLIISVRFTMIWTLACYAIQRSKTPRSIRSQLSRVLGVIGFVILIGGLAISQGYLSKTHTTVPTNSVTFGTALDTQSTSLPVNGDQFQLNNKIYARLSTPSSFHSSTIVILLQHKNGEAFTTVSSKKVVVNPNSHIFVHVFSVTAPGTYQIVFLINDKVIGQNQVTIPTTLDTKLQSL